MTTANDLRWHDLSWDPTLEPRRWPRDVAFPLVRRIDDEAIDDLDSHPFFSRSSAWDIDPNDVDDFRDLDSPELALHWHTRRYRRFFVRVLGTLLIGGAFAGSFYAARDNADARAAVAQWATLGVMK